MSTGKLDGAISGAVTKTLHLVSVSLTFGAPGATGQGPGYNVYAMDADRLILRLPPGPVGTQLSSKSLAEPLQINLEVVGSDHDLFGQGECSVQLASVSSTNLSGSIDCRGLKGESSGRMIDATATFELSS